MVLINFWMSLCVPTFSESNALDFCLMTGILENVPAPFQNVPTDNFPKTYCNVVENDGRLSDDFLAFLKLFKRQQFASFSPINDFQSVVRIVRGSAAAVM